MAEDKPYEWIIEQNIRGDDCNHNGNYSKAERIFRGNLLWYETNRPLDPDKIDVQERLAFSLVELERYEEAAVLQEKVLQYREKTSGHDSSETHSSRQALAEVLSIVGKHDKARKLNQLNWESRKSTLGESNVETLQSQEALAINLYELKDYPAAIKHSRETLRLRERDFKKYKRQFTTIEEVVESRHNLAQSLQKLWTKESLKEATTLNEENVLVTKHNFGVDHEQTKICETALANCIRAAQRQKEAEDTARKFSEKRAKKDNVSNVITLSPSLNPKPARRMSSGSATSKARVDKIHKDGPSTTSDVSRPRRISDRQDTSLPEVARQRRRSLDREAPRQRPTSLDRQDISSPKVSKERRRSLERDTPRPGRLTSEPKSSNPRPISKEPEDKKTLPSPAIAISPPTTSAIIKQKEPGDLTTSTSRLGRRQEDESLQLPKTTRPRGRSLEHGPQRVDKDANNTTSSLARSNSERNIRKPNTIDNKAPKVEEASNQSAWPNIRITKESSISSLYDAHIQEHNQQAKESAAQWFGHLESKTQKLLNEDVVRGKCSKRVKIAILDTGIDKKHPVFAREKHRIVECLSWGFTSNAEVDECGHGTHAAGLLLQYAPTSDIYVARLCKGREDDMRPKDVEMAIKHAVKTWQVDIISMSFGFPRYYENINEAIQLAFSKNVLVFAAAANHGNNVNRAFPASLTKVFCINSSDGHGKTSEFNPKPLGNDNFTVLGEAVNSTWPRKLVEGPKFKLQWGTSSATPIAVVIAALVLEFAYQEPAIEISHKKKLQTYEGMSQVFRSMSTRKAEGYRYLTPWTILDHGKRPAGRTPREAAASRLSDCLLDYFGQEEASLDAS